MSSTPEPFGSSPGTPVDKLNHFVAGLIDMVATQGTRAIDTLGLRSTGTHWFPNVDVVETDTQVLVMVDLPGVDPDGVEVLLAGNMLTVKGKRSVAETPGQWSVHRCERPTGEFNRSVPLPVSVNPDRVSADARHGVLTIELEKEARLVQARHIPIAINQPV